MSTAAPTSTGVELPLEDRSTTCSSPTADEDLAAEEVIDPRVKIELEKLNNATDLINRLELELDDARTMFRHMLYDSTSKLDALVRKLGSCVEKARPYYEARMRAKETLVMIQEAAVRFERANSAHCAAKEMVHLAEEGLMQEGRIFDGAWQEMLNHATAKVNDAEKDRNAREQEHKQRSQEYRAAEQVVQELQKDLKSAIGKSRPYFESKSQVNRQLENQKQRVKMFEQQVHSVKKSYAEALRSLEQISDEIHKSRDEQRAKSQSISLGERGSGVGAECPSPPQHKLESLFSKTDSPTPSSPHSLPSTSGAKSGAFSKSRSTPPISPAAGTSTTQQSPRTASSSALTPQSPVRDALKFGYYSENFRKGKLSGSLPELIAPARSDHGVKDGENSSNNQATGDLVSHLNSLELRETIGEEQHNVAGASGGETDVKKTHDMTTRDSNSSYFAKCSVKSAAQPQQLSSSHSGDIRYESSDSLASSIEMMSDDMISALMIDTRDLLLDLSAEQSPNVECVPMGAIGGGEITSSAAAGFTGGERTVPVAVGFTGGELTALAAVVASKSDSEIKSAITADQSATFSGHFAVPTSFGAAKARSAGNTPRHGKNVIIE